MILHWEQKQKQGKQNETSDGLSPFNVFHWFNTSTAYALFLNFKRSLYLLFTNTLTISLIVTMNNVFSRQKSA